MAAAMLPFFAHGTTTILANAYYATGVQPHADASISQIASAQAAAVSSSLAVCPIGTMPTGSAVVTSTNEDFAGVWGVFAPGRGNVNAASKGGSNDWGITLSVIAPGTKNVSAVRLDHSYGNERWSTNNPSEYPLVVYEADKKLVNKSADTFLLWAGTHTFKIYAQSESQSFAGAKLTFIFDDNSTVAFDVPAVPVAPVKPVVEISVASSSSRTVTGGSVQALISSYTVDTSKSTSPEGVRMSNLAINYKTNSIARPSDLTSCGLYDGSVALNNGANILNPISANGASTTISFNQPIVIPRGVIKTFALKCNVSSSAQAGATYAFDLASPATTGLTSVTSSQNVFPAQPNNTSQPVAVGVTTLSVSSDASAPALKNVSAGSAGVVLNALKVSAVGEAIRLDRIGLKLTSGNSGNLSAVTIWDGATQVGQMMFVGSNTTGTTSLSTPVIIPKNSDKVLVVKADISSVLVPANTSDLVRVDYNGADGARGVGVDSGVTLYTIGTFTNSTGIRVFQSLPSVTIDSLSSSGVSDGKLLRFKVTASAGGPISLAKVGLVVSATSGVTVYGMNIYGYQDASYTQPVSTASGNGALALSTTTVSGSSPVSVIVAATGTSTALLIPAGTTRYFEVRALAILGITTGSSITTTLVGDSTYTVGLSSGAFVWSPFGRVSQVPLNANDWVNGVGVVVGQNGSNQLVQMRAM